MIRRKRKKLGFTRRDFLKCCAIGGAGICLPLKWARNKAYAAIPGGSLPPGDIPKYVTPLVVLPEMPKARKRPRWMPRGMDYYNIAVRQFQQRILPPGMRLPKTTVWGYGSMDHPWSFNYPGLTFETGWNQPARVRWTNDLKDRRGRYLPHLFAVDQTLHWANPAGGNAGRDSRPTFASTPGPYTGPIPTVVHLHGAHSNQESDGYPEAWFLPAAKNIPSGYAGTGTFYDSFKQSSPLGQYWAPGMSIYEYRNDQRAATLWYHDHALGMTRLNVYAGLVGMYIIRGGPDDLPAGVLPGPAPRPRAGLQNAYEIPLVIQDRSFNSDGSLFYPDSRTFFDGFSGPYIPGSDVSPMWNAEFFGNTMVVNGATWPFLRVEQRRYRFRILNACNSRFLILKMDNGIPFWVIGADGGFLPQPAMVNQLLMGKAERLDVIVDFTNVPAGTEITLQNIGPDEPFGGGTPGVDFDSSDPATTGQVMQFRVVKSRSRDISTPPDELTLPPRTPLGAAGNTRQVSLNENDSAVLDDVGPTMSILGTVDLTNPNSPVGTEKLWSDPVTENPALGSTEIWEMYDFTEDAHPVHIHVVQFEIINRQPIGGGPARPPEPWETGTKDTVVVYPGEITRVKALYDIEGQFVWHCHILEHEDNEMMRPYRIG
jgi:spore coat protein A, manganese oxidase